MLYTKLLRFREERLENYEGPTIEYSNSDYHHAAGQEQIISTIESLQPPLPSSRHSRYSILDENSSRRSKSQNHRRQPSAADTEHSYDPFRALSKKQMTKAEAEQAKITILRAASAASRPRSQSVYGRQNISTTLCVIQPLLESETKLLIAFLSRLPAQAALNNAGYPEAYLEDLWLATPAPSESQ